MAESDSSLPVLRASDAERERAVDVLREAIWPTICVVRGRFPADPR